MAEHNSSVSEADEQGNRVPNWEDTTKLSALSAGSPLDNFLANISLPRSAYATGTRANGTFRATAIEQAQRTHGNRSLQRALAGRQASQPVTVQRDPDEEERKLKFSALPPTLTAPLGPLDGTLALGGPELSYKRDKFHANAEYGWGGPLDLGVGYGARLQPWMMDAQPSLSAGGATLPGFLSNPLGSGGLGAVGGMAGMLGDIADSGGPADPWGFGLQASIGPEEQRIMAGLRFNL